MHVNERVSLCDARRKKKKRGGRELMNLSPPLSPRFTPLTLKHILEITWVTGAGFNGAKILRQSISR